MLCKACTHHDYYCYPEHDYATVTTRGVSLTKVLPQFWHAPTLTALTLTPGVKVTLVGAVADAIGMVKVCEITCDFVQHSFWPHGT